jgi:hypothetical protein
MLIRQPETSDSLFESIRIGEITNLVLIGFIKPSETNDTILFASSRNPKSWTAIPLSMIDTIKTNSTNSEHPNVELHLRKLDGESPEVRCLAGLLNAFRDEPTPLPPCWLHTPPVWEVGKPSPYRESLIIRCQPDNPGLSIRRVGDQSSLARFKFQTFEVSTYDEKTGSRIEFKKRLPDRSWYVFHDSQSSHPFRYEIDFWVIHEDDFSGVPKYCSDLTWELGEDGFHKFVQYREFGGAFAYQAIVDFEFHVGSRCLYGPIRPDL